MFTAFTMPNLIPSSVVPISRNIHAAFPVDIGRQIVRRWRPNDNYFNDTTHVAMLTALERPNATCLCQFNTRRGFTVFVVQRDPMDNASVIAYMRDRRVNNTNEDDYAIRDLLSWLAYIHSNAEQSQTPSE